MRVTNSMVMRSTLQDLNRSLARLQESQTRLTTGKTIGVVSDDPTRAMEAMITRAELRRTDQRSRAADDAETRLRLTDTALVSGLELTAKAKELTVRASNSGVADAASRAAIAVEMRAIRDELLAIANTEYLGRSIFSGTTSGSAYDASSGAYLGNDATVSRDVAPGLTIAANVTGEQVFGVQTAPAGDMFAVLDRLATAIEAGDMAAIDTEHLHLDAATERLSTVTAEVGSRAKRLDDVRVRTSADVVEMEQRLSTIEDADIAESLIKMQADENAYQAALGAVAKVITPSLLDYLR